MAEIARFATVARILTDMPFRAGQADITIPAAPNNKNPVCEKLNCLFRCRKLPSRMSLAAVIIRDVLADLETLRTKLQAVQAAVETEAAGQEAVLMKKANGG